MLDVLVLQEVAGLHAINEEFGAGGLRLREAAEGLSAHLKAFEAAEDTELADFLMFGAHSLESHLGQVILLDEQSVDYVISGHAGKRCIYLTYRHSVLACSCFVMSAHLPHKNFSDEEFQNSLEEISEACRKGHAFPVSLIAGDWNCQEGDERFLQLTALMSAHNYSLIYPESATWFGLQSSRTYDFFFVRVTIKDFKLLHPLETADVSVNTAAMRHVGADHALVETQFLLGSVKAHAALPSRPRFSGCKRSYVGEHALQEHLHTLHDVPRDAQTQWDVLRNLSRRCCFPRPRLKYQDSPYLKDLCRQRLGAATPELRHSLSRLILSTRAEEKQQWWQSIEQRAGKGDAQAISFLRRRQSSRMDASPLTRSAGRKIQAAQRVQQHFSDVMSAASPAELQLVNDLQAELNLNAEHTPLRLVTIEELQLHVSKYSHH